MELSENHIKEKVLGCLMGCACGDALGVPTENLHYKDLQLCYGHKITGFTPDVRKKWEAATGKKWNVSDDTYLTLLVARAIIQKLRDIDADDLAELWLEEFDPEMCWIIDRRVYERLQKKVPPEKCGEESMAGDNTIISIAPIGLVHPGDHRAAYTEAMSVGRMTQNGYSLTGAAVFAGVIAHAMDPDSSIDSTIDVILELSDEINKEALNRILGLSRDYSSIDEFTENYYAKFVKREDIGTDVFNHIVAKCRPCTLPQVTEVLPVTLAMFSLSRGNTKDAVIGAVNFGRDADSIASMTGSLCGTFSGFSSLPREWVNYIRTELPEWKIDDVALELTKYIIGKLPLA